MPPSESVDLADPGLYEGGEPELAWARMREVGPVHRNPGEGEVEPFWALVGYEECAVVLRDPATFCSSQGMRVGAPRSSVRAAAGKMMIVTDPPRHGAIRQVLAPLFAPRAARRRQGRIEEIAADVVAKMLDAEAPVDFVAEVTALPAFTVCDLLGVPSADWGEISRLTATAFGAQQSGGIDGDAEKIVAHTELFAYLDDLARTKRREPGEDIVSRLVASPAGAEPFSDDEILLNCEGVINGGIETTRHAASRGVLGFLRNPAQWSRLRKEPQLSATAVEEVLRWATPPLMVMRHATRDVTIAGVPIAAGEPVVVCNAAANRDPAVFPDPEAMLIDRRPNRHLSFGLGPHFCIGAALARMELSALFGALSRRVRAIEGAGEVRHLRSNFIWGLSSLPVILHRADD